MKRYAIAFNAFKDEDGTAYWVTRFNETDNYTYDKNDATLFPDKSAARVLMKTLALDSDHEIIELEV